MPVSRAFGTPRSANRRRGKELSPGTRGRILGLLESGKSCRLVSEIVKVPKSTVHYTLQRAKKHSTTHSLPGRGRKQCLSPSDKRYIYSICRRNPLFRWKQVLQSLDRKISRSTLQRTLREFKLRKWRSKRRIPLSKDGARERLQFVRSAIRNEEEFVEVCSLAQVVSPATANLDFGRSLAMNQACKTIQTTATAGVFVARVRSGSLSLSITRIMASLH
jgi:transposase